MCFLCRQRMRACLRDARGLLVQAERIEADRARHGLAVGKAAIRRHQLVAVLGGHFDEIAQHLVVLDLERGGAGFFAIFRLERGDRLARIARSLAQRVERVVVAARDIAALAAFGRRRGDQRAR